MRPASRFNGFPILEAGHKAVKTAHHIRRYNTGLKPGVNESAPLQGSDRTGVFARRQ
jgi:hypothetical protein